MTFVFGWANTHRAFGDDYSRTLENLLSKGELENAATFFELKSQNPVHDNGAFAALGVVRFLNAVQGLAHSLVRFSPDRNFSKQTLITRFAVEDNPIPDLVTYEELLQIVEDSRTQIALAESTLQSVKTDHEFSLKLNLAI